MKIQPSARRKAGKLYRKVVPDSLQPRMDCARARPHWRRTGAIFVHVPKSAGVSISTALYGRTLGHINAEDIARYASSEFEELVTFAFIRDPVSRFLSAIRYVRDNSKAVRGSAGLPDNFDIFDDPLRFVDEWLAQQCLAKVNYVFRPQASFVCNATGRLLPDFVWQVDHIETHISELEHKIGRSLDLPRLNSTSVDLCAPVDPELVKRIGDIYRQDYDILFR